LFRRRTDSEPLLHKMFPDRFCKCFFARAQKKRQSPACCIAETVSHSYFQTGCTQFQVTVVRTSSWGGGICPSEIKQLSVALTEHNSQKYQQ